jgi:glyoxylase-like metal-dependent hydrolase (beta-lactamase superfamily II)
VIDTHYHADHSWGTVFPGDSDRPFLVPAATEKGTALAGARRQNGPPADQDRPTHLTFDDSNIGLRVGKKICHYFPAKASPDNIGILVDEDRGCTPGCIYAAALHRGQGY